MADGVRLHLAIAGAALEQVEKRLPDDVRRWAPSLPQGVEGPNPIPDADPIAQAIAQVQDLIRTARTLEADLTAALARAGGRTPADRVGNLPDGRQFRLHRTADRKGWDHDAWKRDARARVVRETVGDTQAALRSINTETGEVEETTLAALVHEALAMLQEFHGATAPRTGTLRKHGLDPDEYAETKPGAWKFDAIAPSDTTTED